MAPREKLGIVKEVSDLQSEVRVGLGGTGSTGQGTGGWGGVPSPGPPVTLPLLLVQPRWIYWGRVTSAGSHPKYSLRVADPDGWEQQTWPFLPKKTPARLENPRDSAAGAAAERNQRAPGNGIWELWWGLEKFQGKFSAFAQLRGMSLTHFPELGVTETAPALGTVF